MIRETLAAICLLILVASVVTVAQWDYIKIFNDPQGDNSGYPGYTDIVEVTYAFNETLVAVNITVNETIPLPVPREGEVYFYNFFLDVDKSNSTGYTPWWAPNELGADYLVQAYIDNTTQKPVARVLNYTGTGGIDWRWETIIDGYEARVFNDNTIIELYAMKGYLELPSGDIYFAVSTQRGDDLADYLVVGSTTGGPVPIPEPGLLVAASIIAVVIIGFAWYAYKWF